MKEEKFTNNELSKTLEQYFCGNKLDDICTDKKFSEISRAIDNGQDLYKFIKEYINKNSSVNEKIIKHTIAKYISILRYGTDGHIYDDDRKITEAIISENLNLQSMVELFTTELQIRYFFSKDNTNKVSYYKKLINPIKISNCNKEALIHNEEIIATICHSTGWHEVQEKNIIEKNPWKELAKEYIKSDLLYSEIHKFVIKEDLPIIDKYNNSKKHKVCRYHLEIPAEPWRGNPLKAKIIILSLNPGWKEECNKNIALRLDTNIRKAILKDKSDTLTLKVNSFMPNNKDIIKALTELDNDYWTKRLDALNIKNINKETFYENFALIQYCAYASERYGGQFENGKLLPSQIFLKELIRYLVYHRREIKFIMLRAEDKWKQLLDPDVWYMLQPRLIRGKNYRQQYLTKNNIGENNYNKLVDLINHR